jgi:hypothetical protein
MADMTVPICQPSEPPRQPGGAEYPPCEAGLSVREWLVAGAIIVCALAAISPAWRAVEPFNPPPDYRLPYEQGNDYWQFERFSHDAADRGGAMVLGDSVIWGHYVPADAALPARLAAIDLSRRYWNMGVDGIHPAAMAGLLEHFGGAMRGRHVILHCNLLWMSSPRHDLRDQRAGDFPLNHPRLLPQFGGDIPAFREPLEKRLSAAIGREAPAFLWAAHLREAYFGGLDIPAWTVENPGRNPLAAISLKGSRGEPLPPPGTDERNWVQKGMRVYSPQWVDLERSIQWRYFRESVERLASRGNRVLVIVGPMNEHMMTADARAGYRDRAAAVADWLGAKGIACFVAPLLPSEEYADASHPLSAGYSRLARELSQSEAFRGWERK